MKLRGAVPDRINIDNPSWIQRIRSCHYAVDTGRQERAGRACVRGEPGNGGTVKHEYMIKLVQQSKIPAVTLESTGPEFEQVYHRNLAQTAPVWDTRKFNKALRAPGDENK